MIKNGFISYTVKYFAAVSLLTVLLFVSALIPRKMLQSNLLSSARFLCQGELFDEVWDGVPASEYDRYADSILLNIAWNYDSEHPVRSVMESSYYHSDTQNENLNLYDAVTKELGDNYEYLRYWHGSIVLVRPLLMIMPIQGMYIFLGAVLLILSLTLIWRLIRKKEAALATGLSLGLILTYSWFVPFCLEYIWTFLIMLTVSHLILHKDMDDRKFITILMISGIVTAYMDFLTTETLTLTVPLIIAVKIRAREDDRLFALKSVIGWGVGYVGMFVLKWILAAVFLGPDAVTSVLTHAEERTGGLVLDEAYFRFLGPIGKNLLTMMPFSLGSIGVITGCILLFACIYTGYVYHGKNIRSKTILIYTLTAFVPIIRYLAIRNHSVLHFFFTFRALMAVILALVMVLYEAADIQLILSVWKKNNGKKRR